MVETFPCKTKHIISSSGREEIDGVVKPFLFHASVPTAVEIQSRQMKWKQKVKHEIMLRMHSANLQSDFRSLNHLLN